MLGVMLSSMTMAQISIVGTVMDEKGETLPGVTIQVKGLKKGTVTNIDGKFGLSVGNVSNVLLFSYVGYETKELKVDKSKPMQVVLKEESHSLNEVMVIGYQDVRKKDVTGSVAKANITDMLKAPVSSFDQALGGRIAGVVVSSSEGSPGSTMNIVIRGQNSISQENSPLYVIDGFPVEDPAVGSSINPNDIESIDVLKDASATAIYGSRGANGVIIITTKKGIIGAPVITYDGNYSIQHVSKKMDMMNAYDFVKLQTEIYTPTELLASYSYFAKDNTGHTWTLDDYRNVPQLDWQDMVLREAIQQSHNLSITGGTAALRYNASVSYFDQDGVIIGSNYNRIQGKLGVSIRRDKLNLNLSTNYASNTRLGSVPSDQQSSGMNNLFFSVFAYRPITGPNTDINSLYEDAQDAGVSPINDYRFNPILSLKNEFNKSTANYNQYNGFAEYELSKGLKFKASGGYTLDNKKGEVFNNSNTRYGSPISTNKVNASVSTTERTTWLNEDILTYQVDINKSHFFNTLLGYSAQESNYKAYGMQSIYIPNENLGIAGMNQGTPNTIGSAWTSWSMQSYFGRLNYNYKSKYYLTASYRIDGCSKFAVGNQYGYFPSGSVAWNFAEEKFLGAIRNVLKSGKLRASWGLTGNNRIGEYDTYSLLDMPKSGSVSPTISNSMPHGIYPFNNTVASVGAVPVNLANANLKWETTAQTNLGIDLGIVNDRVNFTFDWYNKTTYDLLLFAGIPPSSGFSGAMKNIGKVQNQGLEFTMNTINFKTKKFSWTSNFNISFNTNRILELAEKQTTMLSNAYFDNGYTSPNYIAKIGDPIGMMYGYIFDGTYKNSDFDITGATYALKPGVARYTSEANTLPGHPKYRDLNLDGIIDSNDQTTIGRGAPIHTGGFTNNFEYAGFDLSVFLQWSYGANILNANKLFFEGGYRKESNQFASYNNRWTIDNPNSDMPRYSSSSSNTVFSSRLIEDGSYLRLKTLSLGYNVNAKLLKRFKISKLRVFVSAQNLYTLTKYSGYDPEVSVRNSALSPGLDYSSYPRTVSMNMGTSISF